MATVRRTCEDTAGSCVTTSTVTPSSLLAVCIAPNTSRAVALSSSPVGSSASSTRGLVGQRGGDRGALLLATGHLFGNPPGAVAHSEYAEQLAGSADPLTPPQPGKPHRQRHVLQPGQAGPPAAGGLLPDEADYAAPVRQPLPPPPRRQT